MTPEEKSLLERTCKLAEENNRLLKGIRRSARWSSVMRYVYWIIIIVLSFGAYYFIQPYVNFIMTELGSLQGNAQNGTSSSQGLMQALRNL